MYDPLLDAPSHDPPLLGPVRAVPSVRISDKESTLGTSSLR